MKLTSKTITLLVVAVLLLGLNLVDQGSANRQVDRLPELPALVREDVRRIEISSAAEKIVLASEPTDEGEPRWRMVAPLQRDADQVSVRTVLSVFRKAVPIDVQVDSGNLETYGLDATNGVVVEFFTGEVDPEISFTIGWDGPGGTSFLRLSGSDAVYRARVGGRARYARPATEWRNKVLLEVPAEAFSLVEVTREGQPDLVLERMASGALDDAGQPVPGAWALEPDPGWPADQKAIDAMLQRVGSMRASEILGSSFEGGFDPPAAKVHLGLSDGTTRDLVIGRRAFEGAAFVKVDEDPDVYRVAASNVQMLLLPPDEFRDKQIFSFSRGDVDTLSLTAGGTTMILQQDLSNGMWRVIQPRNVDVDVKLVYFAVNTLAELRAHQVADGVTLAQAGLVDPASRLVVRFLDGRTVALELGKATTDAQGRPCFFARRADSETVVLLRDAAVAKLKAAFGR